LEDWEDPILRAFSASNHEKVDQGLTKDVEPTLIDSIIFISYILVTTFYVLNMFVMKMISNFTMQAEIVDGIKDMSNEEKGWLNVAREIVKLNLKISRQAPTNPIRKFCYDLVCNNHEAIKSDYL
jgi:hypothetical protein